MKQAVFVRHKRERNVYHVVWFEQGRERTKSFNTRQEAEKEKRSRLELITAGNGGLGAFDSLSPHEKRDLHALHERARINGYELWDAVRQHEKALGQDRMQAITVREAVESCLEDKHGEGITPRSLQSLRSVLLRFAGRHGDRQFADITHAEVSAFVDGMNVGLRTRLGYLTDIRTLFSWGIQKGLAGSNPIVAAMPGRATRRKIMLAKRERRKEQVLGVEDCRALLGWTRAHDPGLLVYPVLCLPAPVHRQLPRTGLISRIVLNRGWSILPPLLMGYQLSKCPCTKFQMLVRRVPVKRSNLSLRSGDLFQCNQPFYDRLNIIGYGYLAQ